MKNIKIIAGLVLVVALAIGITIIFTTSTETSVAFKTHDDLLKDVGSRTSEFGGMYLSDDNNTLYVYMTSGTQNIQKQQEVKGSIETVFSSDLTGGRNIEVVPAQYSMSQLYGWYSQMMPAAFGDSRVVMTDLDESENRLEIGVDSLSVVPDLELMLGNLGIPREAVAFSERKRPSFTSHTLSSRAPNGVIEGGYQIARSGFSCTLGFNTERDGEDGFVTAGHCTEANSDWGEGNVGTEFYQPTVSNNNLVGEETIDPAFSDSYSNCPDDTVCRLSDSAFISLDSDASQNLGKIARPVSLGSRVVHHDIKFRITDEVSHVAIDQFVSMVGRSSGWQSGRITKTCTHYSAGPGLLLCQNEIDLDAGPGDSGAPIFSITNSPNTYDVDLLGVYWGQIDDNAYYSPIGGVYYDLGRFDTWDSCDPSQDC